MDITCVGENQYKLKSKKGSLEVTLGEKVEIVSGGNTNSPFVIRQPGEYEVDGMSVFAYAATGGIAALVQVDDIKIFCLANIIDDSVIEEQETVDVVLLSCDNVGSKDLVEMIGKIEPSYVVPAGSKEFITKFVSTFEHTAREMPKLSLTKATINAEITDVVILTG